MSGERHSEEPSRRKEDDLVPERPRFPQSEGDPLRVKEVGRFYGYYRFQRDPFLQPAVAYDEVWFIEPNTVGQGMEHIPPGEEPSRCQEEGEEEQCGLV